MKIKIFNYYFGTRLAYADTITKLEYELNHWIEYDKPEIKQFTQSNTKEYLIYTFLYYEKKELRKTKLEKINEL